MAGDIIKKSKKLHQMISSANSIAIIGHIHPDGDCIGSNLAMYNYITDNYKGKTVQVYDESFPSSFKFLSGSRKIKHEPTGERYDLAISIDVSDKDRLGKFADIYNNAISTVCIDHHVSNPGFGDLCYIDGDASSACEAMCDLIDMDKVGEKTMRKFFRTYFPELLYNYTDDRVITLPNADKESIILCDIDGTIALHNGRSPFDYDKASEDTFDPRMKVFLNSLSQCYKIIFFSGRSEDSRPFRWPASPVNV